ncbi:MAG TPA: DUF4286 family protein [Hanamia sp.]
MIVYNDTTKVDHEIVEEWVSWQKENYIPEVMATGFCTGFRFYKLLDHDDDEGRIFITQFLINNRQDYDTLITRFLASLKKKTSEKWGDKALSFYTLLQNME